MSEQINNQLEQLNKTESLEIELANLMNAGMEVGVKTDDFEVAEMARNKATSLLEWRQAKRVSDFGVVYDVIEEMTAVDGATNERQQELKSFVAERGSEYANGQSPQVADFIYAMTAEFAGEKHQSHFETTTEKLERLKKDGDLEVLFDARFDWQAKANRIKSRIEGFLEGAADLDAYEQKKAYEKRKESAGESDSSPSPERNSSKPSMDEMDRVPDGEEVSSIWSINPARGGYFKEQSFSHYDSVKNEWTEADYGWQEINVDVSELNDGAIEIGALMRTNVWTRLPMPYGFEIAKISSGENNCRVKQDKNGDYSVLIENKQFNRAGLSCVLIQKENSKLKSIETPKSAAIACELTKETEEKLAEIKIKKQKNLERAVLLKSYIGKRIKYSNNSSLNAIYESYSRGYIAAIDEMREADCDVANTYFAALCARLDIPVRHCVGHSVSGKDDKGNSRITSGTGHAWSEVWDEITSEWMRVDATPPGDPQLSDEKQKSSEAVPGDYGEQEAIAPSDEYLEELAKKLAERAEELSYTEEERELAEASGVELKEARNIMAEIKEAEDARLPNGELIRDQLSRLFDYIIESRRVRTVDYTGPLKKSEGGEDIDDVVAHYIGVQSNETDPRSRQKEIVKEKQEKIFGGFDLYLIGDKSGSMNESVDGAAKWKLQRKSWILLLSSLHRFEEKIKRSGLLKDKNLSIRTQGISFRDSKIIDEDKELSGEFGAKDKVKLWKSLSNQGSGNGDVAALSHIYSQVKKEIEEQELKGKKDDRLRIVIACSDGYPDDVTGVHQLVEMLGKMNAVVVGIGMTETAAAVEKIFTTTYSHGDLARDLNDLPVIVAKYVIKESIKLFPEKAKTNAKNVIEGYLKKFKI